MFWLHLQGKVTDPNAISASSPGVCRPTLHERNTSLKRQEHVDVINAIGKDTKLNEGWSGRSAA